MLTSSANVDEFTCPKPEIYGKIMPPVQPKAEPPHAAKTADLIYEIWDHQQRKFRIQVKDAIPLRKWAHIVITAHNADAFRPDIGIYVNGEQVFVEPSGFLPQTSVLSNCYVGKSNWTNVTSQYENK
ncbi:MAG: LamG domain-containing protein, partial [Deltaproteobacteria bacterium]|nr:LamG domain-containing protein [Deltaproteobacteria bacterium]